MTPRDRAQATAVPEPDGTTCALCGARVTADDQACGSCPLSCGCGLACCPSCGYQFPRRSVLADAWQRLAARWSAR